jgi:uncharacterized protein YbcI
VSAVTTNTTQGGGATSQLLQIANAMVHIYKEQFGRGPTEARAAWCGENVITVLLENTLTPAERTLVQMGEHQRVRETRMVFQYSDVRGFCGPIEAITGRTVRAFISGTDAAVNGLSVETFVLHEAGSERPSRIDVATPSRNGAIPKPH